MYKREKVNQLKNRLKEIEPIVSVSFNTRDELLEYFEKNKSVYEEAHEIHKEIEKIEWELMSPEERKKNRRTTSFI